MMRRTWTACAARVPGRARPKSVPARASPARPIVLLRKLRGCAAGGRAGGPPAGAGRHAAHDARCSTCSCTTTSRHARATPTRDAAGDMLVMTSGNMHDEPIEIGRCHGRASASGAGGGRVSWGTTAPSCARYDDSVVRVLDVGVDAKASQPTKADPVIRRAREVRPRDRWCSASRRCDGAAGGAGACQCCQPGRMLPALLTEPLLPPRPPRRRCSPPGPEQKSTFCVRPRQEDAFVSQHIGDLEDADGIRCVAGGEGLATSKLFDLRSRRWPACGGPPPGVPVDEVGRARAGRESAPSAAGQSPCSTTTRTSRIGHRPSRAWRGRCAASRSTARATAMDGAIWGGEVLLCEPAQDFERFANFGLRAHAGRRGVPSRIRCAWRTARCGSSTCWSTRRRAQALQGDLGVEADICQPDDRPRAEHAADVVGRAPVRCSRRACWACAPNPTLRGRRQPCCWRRPWAKTAERTAPRSSRPRRSRKAKPTVAEALPPSA
jgi:hypothetical protein